MIQKVCEVVLTATIIWVFVVIVACLVGLVFEGLQNL